MSPTGPGGSFIDWARASLAPLDRVKPGPSWRDLEPFGHMVGDATVVALGEDIHCAAEPLEFRNRILQYLVREKGFTAIAIEAGLVESRLVHEYVRAGAGDLDTVLAQGISWTFDCLPQNRALVEWLRAYNANPKNPRQVNFYGFDVPGSPGNPDARRAVETALLETLDYLDRIDRNSAASFRDRLHPLMTHLRLDGGPAGGYELLRQAERDTLTAVITDAIALLEWKEAQYTALGTAPDYAWGYRAALGARQMDNWLRRLPVGWQPVGEVRPLSHEQIDAMSAASNVRDRAQADNLDWIVQQEGPAGKILVFAHWAHLSSAAVKVIWPGGEEREQQNAGTYLRRRLGERLVMIGNLIGQGEVECGNYQEILERAPPESIAFSAGELGKPLYVLDLRQAPDAVRSELLREQVLGHGPIRFKTAVGKAFDILFYIDTVTPACVQPRL